MIRRAMVCVGVLLAVTACSSTTGSPHPSRSVPTTVAPAPKPGSAAPTARTAIPAGDRVLIRALYARLTRAFAVGVPEGVRAILATQYPGDRADVAFARCVSTIAQVNVALPHATSLSFVPDFATSVADPSYVLSSARVHSLHPEGRIYETKVTIVQGAQTSVHLRHQVVLDNHAYQFSTC